MKKSTPSLRIPDYPATQQKEVTASPSTEPSSIHYDGAKEPIVSPQSIVGAILFILVLAWVLYHFTTLS